MWNTASPSPHCFFRHVTLGNATVLQWKPQLAEFQTTLAILWPPQLPSPSAHFFPASSTQLQSNFPVLFIIPCFLGPCFRDYCLIGTASFNHFVSWLASLSFFSACHSRQTQCYKISSLPLLLAASCLSFLSPLFLKLHLLPTFPLCFIAVFLKHHSLSVIASKVPFP